MTDRRELKRQYLKTRTHWLASMPACQASFVECVQPLGLPGPAVLRRVLALEKIGLIAREGARDARALTTF